MSDDARTDDQDATKRHDLPAESGRQPLIRAAGEPATPPADSPVGDASAALPDVERYSPPPEARPEWSRHADSAAAPAPTPERWYEPAAPVAGPVATTAVQPANPRRGGTASVVTAALLAAVLASGGTVLALNATGALDRPVATTTPPTGSTVGTNNQPVTIDEQSATIDVAAAVSPAVVRITTGSADTSTGIIPATGVGSGVIYDTNGWILTNRHVVEGNNNLTVELNDGRRLEGTVYGIDTLTDLAIVKVDGDDLTAAKLGDSSSLKVGQLVVAIGSPLGTFTNSVTSGIVSAKGRSIATDNNQNLNNLIQTDAAINPGNSGGPLLDASGNVVGINTAIAADASGIGFAIPIDIARPIMDQAIAGEKIARPYMGVVYRPVDRQLASDRNLPTNDGALVIAGANGGSPAVVPGSPADQAGIKEGDVIVKVNGHAIDRDNPLDATLSEHAPGDTVTIELLRDGQTLNVQLTLATRPGDLG